MAYKITDSCTSCGSCESECPVEAISQGDSQYEIDESACTSCGLCASVCPVDAIIEG
ncbi:MAG: 4Fe-4S binding protein [Spirochaetes bacterium]|nr:4Fe-4S binding protein [Spirochaetota bacterium]MBN2771827.1 4Fe-4S binding protein [Spirochaetota bacterium]HRX17000.1 4Fe-4S binding protein [Spirochaetota bacterium]